MFIGVIGLSAIKVHALYIVPNVLSVHWYRPVTLKCVDRSKPSWTPIFVSDLMGYSFSKWHGTGNDFILLDDREHVFPTGQVELVRLWCDRHFGIGSDGLILVQPPSFEGTDFHMEFFNPDGSRSFCGNGSRCAFAFWSQLNDGAQNGRFTAIDGVHDGTWELGDVSISLPRLSGVKSCVDGSFVDSAYTGSPHELVWVPDVDLVDIVTDGPKRRYAERHGPGGSNVNYVQPWENGIRMRTYERGVEAETLSCGSGVVAAALSAIDRRVAGSPVAVTTRGGRLTVRAVRGDDGSFEQVRLTGPVKEVFKGTITE
jgi:diaminopimelate epimerase